MFVYMCTSVLLLALPLLQSEVDIDTGEPLDTLSSVCIQHLQDLGSSCTTVSEVITTKDKIIFDAINEGVERANRQATSNAQTVKKWRLLVQDFSIPGGELGNYLCYSVQRSACRSFLSIQPNGFR